MHGATMKIIHSIYYLVINRGSKIPLALSFSRSPINNTTLNNTEIITTIKINLAY